MYASWNTCSALPQPVGSYGLAEVFRLIDPASWWTEGLSSGWANRSSMIDASRRVKYGCWFFLAPGSGIFLNVGRTLAAHSREELRHLLKLPPKQPTDFSDNDLCTGALREGNYTTLQIGGRHDNGTWATSWAVREQAPPELVLCAGDCITEESRSPCPGVPLLQPNGSPCECSAEAVTLNCNAGRLPPNGNDDPCAARDRLVVRPSALEAHELAASHLHFVGFAPNVSRHGQARVGGFVYEKGHEARGAAAK